MTETLREGSLFSGYDRDSSSWRTSPSSNGEGSTLSSLTLPNSGSMRSGSLSRRPEWEPLTVDNGSSLLLKTPNANLASNGGSQHPDKRKAGGHGPTLADEVEWLLPTPLARDTKGSGDNPNRQGSLSDVFCTGATTGPPSDAGRASPAA